MASNVWDIPLVGYRAEEGQPSAKLVRHLDEVVHHECAADDEFRSDEERRKQIVKLQAANVARRAKADGFNE